MIWMLMLGIVFKSIFLGGITKETIVKAYSDQNTENEAIDKETYFQVDEESLEEVLVKYSKHVKKNKCITSLSEMYGDSISDEEIIYIAKIKLC